MSSSQSQLPQFIKGARRLVGLALDEGSVKRQRWSKSNGDFFWWNCGLLKLHDVACVRWSFVC